MHVIAAVEKLPIPVAKTAIVFRHGDPNPHNLLLHQRSITAVDWESAVEGPAIIDIVDFFMKANLTERKKKLFLKTYGNPVSGVELFTLYRLLAMAVWHLEQYALWKKGKTSHEPYIALQRRHLLFERRLEQAEALLGRVA